MFHLPRNTPLILSIWLAHALCGRLISRPMLEQKLEIEKKAGAGARITRVHGPENNGEITRGELLGIPRHQE